MEHVQEQADTCPECGRKITWAEKFSRALDKPWYKNEWGIFFLVILGFYALSVLAGILEDMNGQPAPIAPAASAAVQAQINPALFVKAAEEAVAPFVKQFGQPETKIRLDMENRRCTITMTFDESARYSRATLDVGKAIVLSAINVYMSNGINPRERMIFIDAQIYARLAEKSPTGADQFRHCRKVSYDPESDTIW